MEGGSPPPERTYPCCVVAEGVPPPPTCCSGCPASPGASSTPSVLTFWPSSSWMPSPGSPPPPPAGRARVIVDHALARLGGGSTIGRRQACCSCIPGSPWQIDRRSLHDLVCVPAPLAWPQWGLGRGTVRRQIPSLLPLLAVWCQGLPPRSSFWSPLAPPRLRVIVFRSAVLLLPPRSLTSPPPFPPPPPPLALAPLPYRPSPPGGHPPLLPGPASRGNARRWCPTTRLL